MRKIAVFTGSRAEYGLLYWLMKGIQQDNDLSLQLLVTGMHLSPQYGETWREIVADGFTIDERVEMLLSSDSSVGIVKSMGLATIGFADALERLKPDALVILGDRFEALAVAQAALIMKIPIVHIHGGELTLGAYDNAIRHAISKMASLHFTAAKEYQNRLIQMGEEASTVFNTGAPGLEHIAKLEPMTVQDLGRELNIPLQKPYFLVTFHPVTLQDNANESFENLLQTLDDNPSYQLLFTYPNADNGGHKIIAALEQYCKKNSNRAFAVKSLGYKRYLNAIAHAELVIGNSSSGIIEVPAFAVPCINIGLRQQGRLAAKSVIHTDETPFAIQQAINKALTPEFKTFCSTVTNPYGDGEVSARIIPILKTHPFTPFKHFQDLDFHV